MARRPGSEGALELSPRARRIGGWIAAALLLGVFALAFRLLGGNGDGTVTTPSPSGAIAGLAPIRFGTALDPASGEVAADGETDRFTSGDTFAYSVEPTATVPAAVYVEVRRTSGGPTEVTQSPTDPQPLGDARVIAFTVPAEALLDAFGPGSYTMLIYAEADGGPLAEGRFELIEVPSSPATSP